MEGYAAGCGVCLHDRPMTWRHLAQQQAGVITFAQLVASGDTRHTVRHLVCSGALVRHELGVYTIGGAPFTYASTLWIAVLASNGVLGYASAAHLWDLDVEPDVIDLIVDPSRRVIRRRGVRLHRVFVPRSAITRLNGLPVTRRTWSVLDHLSLLGAAASLRLADRALQRGWVARTDFERRLADFPGRRGNARIRALLEQTSDRAAAESERRLHRLLRSAGVAGWVANYPVRIEGRLVAVIDVAIPERRLAIEVDGMAHHIDVDRFQHDRRRRNILTSLGWTVLQFTWQDLTERPEYVIRTILANCGA